MTLKYFKANKINGYINFNHEFDPKLTFVYGINGTGKTTILKLIVGLIYPSYDYLSKYDFESIELSVNFNNEKVIIKSFKINEIKYISYISNKEELTDEIEKIPVNLFYNKFNDFYDEELHYHRQKFYDLQTIKKIRELNSPVFLGLERRLDNDINNIKKKKRNNVLSSNLDTIDYSIVEVQNIIYDHYRLITSEQPKIINKLKDELLSNFFEIVPNDELSMNTKKELNNLLKNKDHYKNIIGSLSAIGLADKFDNFITKFEELERKYSEIIERDTKSINLENEENTKIFQSWFLNYPQISRIRKIIKTIDTYQNEIKRLYKKVDQLIELANKFFKEANKKVSVNSDGSLEIALPNGIISNLYDLSSGEKQILIILTYLIFYEHLGIFIIDEPELSLHISWQELFVSSILEASPKTQFLLSTHSPSIISNHFEKFKSIDIGLNI